MTDVPFKAFAGVCNTLPAERLKPTDLTAAVNVTIDDSGRVTRRDGQVLLAPGVGVHSLWAEGDLCCYVKGGGMYRLWPDLTAQLVALGLSDDPMTYVRVADRVYHSNGKTTGLLAEGSVRGWGIPLDSAVVGISPTTGHLPPGTYQCALTWLTRDGRESGTGLAARLDLPHGGGIRFVWTAPADMHITEAALYVTQANGEVLHQALVVDVEDEQASYVGGDRSLPLATQWLDAPPAGQCLAFYRGRIYIAAGPYLYATSPHGLEYCDLRDYLAIDGSRINVLLPVDGGLFVGTEQGVYFLAGAALAEHSLVAKSAARAVAGSGVLADGQKVTGRAELAGVKVVLLTTSDGVLLGLSDGSMANLTQERYQFAAGQRAAAILQPEATRTDYLLSMQP